jgi:surface antigen
MRIAITASILLAAAAAGLPGAAQARGVFGCDAAGGKQEGGAVIGAIVGGIIGNQVAKNERGLGTAVGAGLGAAAGSAIGCKIQEDDKRKAEAALEQALSTGYAQNWRNPSTGSRGDVQVEPWSAYGDGYGQPIRLQSVSFARGVQPQRNWEGGGTWWFAPNTVNLRGAPSTKSAIVGKLAGGQDFQVLAKVAGANWLLVGQNGYATGYVSASVVRPRGGDSGDCRRITQTIYTKKYGSESERFRACRKPSGSWDLTKI